ncbi:TetR/AcrR family transcriptional regulator [Clostridium malenominatum]|uniref:TetR/AcrR family transcriptional regulator n=1 Tax=Clostridium malenominatum TaxID=1539 RepID=A0ABN1J0G0_9CLOT
MKQRERNEASKDKILKAAIAEFGTKIYENASLNNICNDNNISKGLIYHYFKNKDELYLCCVKTCIDEFIDFLNNEERHYSDFQKDIKTYLDLRNQFFSNNPLFSNIFFGTVLQPPVHLKDEIKKLRTELDMLNVQRYKNALSNIVLRDEVSEDEAIEYFIIFQEMFNGYFQSKAYEFSDFNSLIEAHEMKMSKILDIMLYGIVKEDK